MTDRLVVGLEGWIIQDTNYRDFALDMDAAFALEFHPQVPLEEFQATAALSPSVTHVGNGCHDIVGQVVYVADDWWIIDAGYLVLEHQPPPAHVRRGGWLRGNVYIGVDPYFYFEQLGHEPSTPALIYDWKIEKIEMQTAPLIEVKPRVMARDPAKLGWAEIEKTNAWEDAGEYLLHCVPVGGPRLPRSKREP